MRNLVIVTNGNYFANRILEPLLDDPRFHVKGIVIVNGDYTGRTGVRALWRYFQSTTFPYVIYKLFQHFFCKLVLRFIPGAVADVSQSAARRGLPLLLRSKVNSKDVVDFISDLQPDLLVSISCPQRIKKKILLLPTLGAVNIHSSLLPAYAGLAPYFWVLAQGERETGISVHTMTEAFDEGNILVQKNYLLGEKTSAFGLFQSLAEMGSQILPRALDMVIQGNAGTVPTGCRTYFSHPDWRSYRSLRARGHRLIRLGDLKRVIRESQNRQGGNSTTVMSTQSKKGHYRNSAA